MWGFGDCFRRETKQSLSVSPRKLSDNPTKLSVSPPPLSLSDRSVNPPSLAGPSGNHRHSLPRLSRDPVTAERAILDCLKASDLQHFRRFCSSAKRTKQRCIARYINADTFRQRFLMREATLQGTAIKATLQPYSLFFKAASAPLFVARW